MTLQKIYLSFVAVFFAVVLLFALGVAPALFGFSMFGWLGFLLFGTVGILFYRKAMRGMMLEFFNITL